MLELASSKLTVLELKSEKQGFEAHESRDIDFLVPPQNQNHAGLPEEVLVHINDQTGRVSETLLFKIRVK
jgi:hypothetical protein